MTDDASHDLVKRIFRQEVEALTHQLMLINLL